MFDNLKANMKVVGNLNDADFDLLVSRLKSKALKKGEHLLEAGSVCKSLAYVENGLAMYYRVSDGNEIPVDFGIENDWISDLKSFNSQIPSDLNILALEDMDLHCISFSDLQQVFTAQPKFLALKNYYFERSFMDIAQ